MTPLVPKIKALYQKRGYTFFTGPWNLNIIGIRSRVRTPDEFDDLIGIVYELAGNEVAIWFRATVDSGKFYLQQPLSPNGTAILLPGQYRGVYKKGIHGRTWASGGYPALEQAEPMLYFRDNNRDAILDIPESIFEAHVLAGHIEKGLVIRDNIKSNIHRAAGNSVVEFVGKYSAACQVIQSPRDFNSFMRIIDSALENGHPNRFTYTLLHEEDLNRV